jgi:nicotinic acid phosphoribosyltransferase
MQSALFTDFYALTMAQGLLEEKNGAQKRL